MLPLEAWALSDFNFFCFRQLSHRTLLGLGPSRLSFILFGSRDSPNFQFRYQSESWDRSFAPL